MSSFIFDNPENYKSCTRKQYDAYVCMPPVNTIVLNVFENPNSIDAFRRFGNKTYFTVNDIKMLQERDIRMISLMKEEVAKGNIYVVTKEKPFVVCGTQGEFYTMSARELASQFNFIINNQQVEINTSSLNNKLKDGILDWTLIRSKAIKCKENLMACFVPLKENCIFKDVWHKYGVHINDTRLKKHGKGDFIVCKKLPNGQLDFSKRKLVNGLIFSDTFNNKGWTDCLDLNNKKEITIEKLPKLCTLDNNTIKVLTSKQLYKKFKDLGFGNIKGVEQKKNSDIVIETKGISKEELSKITLSDGRTLGARLESSKKLVHYGVFSYTLDKINRITHRNNNNYKEILDGLLYSIYKTYKNQDQLFFDFFNKYMQEVEIFQFIGIRKNTDKVYENAVCMYYKYCEFQYKESKYLLLAGYGSNVDNYVGNKDVSEAIYIDMFSEETFNETIKHDAAVQLLIKSYDYENAYKYVSSKLLSNEEKMCYLIKTLENNLEISCERYNKIYVYNKYSSDDRDYLSNKRIKYLENNEKLAIVFVKSFSGDEKFQKHADFIGISSLFISSIFGHIQKDQKFLFLHPVKKVAFLWGRDGEAAKVIFELEDNNFIHCYTCFDNQISIDYYKADNINRTLKKSVEINISKSDIEEYYNLAKNVNTIYSKEGFGNNIIGYVHRTDLSIFNNSKVYAKINKVVDAFFKPRKLESTQFLAIFSNIAKKFEYIVYDYGLHILESGKFNQDNTAWKCTIDGDNDDHLTLIFNMNLTKETMGIRIRGKSNKATLNEVVEILDCSNKEIDEVITDGTKFSLELFNRVCEVLGVSKWRKFYKKDFIENQMYFKTKYIPNNTDRNTKITKYDIPAFKAQVMYKDIRESLLIKVKVFNPNSNSYELLDEVLTGNISENTVNELNIKILNILLTVQSNNIKNVFSIALKSNAKKYFVEDLRYIEKIDKDNISWKSSRYTVSSVIKDNDIIDNELVEKDKRNEITVSYEDYANFVVTNLDYYNYR